MVKYHVITGYLMIKYRVITGYLIIKYPVTIKCHVAIIFKKFNRIRPIFVWFNDITLFRDCVKVPMRRSLLIKSEESPDDI